MNCYKILSPQALQLLYLRLLHCRQTATAKGSDRLFEIFKQTVIHLEEISYDFIQITSGLYLHIKSAHTLHCIPASHTKNSKSSTTKLN